MLFGWLPSWPDATADFTSLMYRNGSTSRSSIAECHLSIEGMDLTFDTVFHRYNDPPAVVIATLTSNESIRIYIGPRGAVFAVLFDRDGRPATTAGTIAKLQIPNISALPQITPLLRDEDAIQSDYVRRTMNTDRASLHFRNELLLLPDAFRALKRLAEPTWPGLRIRELTDAHGKLALLVQDNDFTAEVAWMGHGLQMWLQALWFLARTDYGSTVILDEPDVYLHADLQRKLIASSIAVIHRRSLRPILSKSWPRLSPRMSW